MEAKEVAESGVRDRISEILFRAPSGEKRVRRELFSGAVIEDSEEVLEEKVWVFFEMK